MKNILVTCAGDKMKSVMASLVSTNYKLFATDIEYLPQYSDSIPTFKVPKVTYYPEEYLDTIIQICKSYNIDYIIPILEEESEVLLSSSKPLPKIITYRGKKLEDKSVILKLFNQPVLNLKDNIDNLDNIKSFIEKHSTVVLKPLNSRGSRGVKFITKFKSLINNDRTGRFLDIKSGLSFIEYLYSISEISYMLEPFYSGIPINVDVLYSENGIITFPNITPNDMGFVSEIKYPNEVLRVQIHNYAINLVNTVTDPLKELSTLNFEVNYDIDRDTFSLIELNCRPAATIFINSVIPSYSYLEHICIGECIFSKSYTVGSQTYSMLSYKGTYPALKTILTNLKPIII